MTTLEQKIAQKEDELARLKAKSRKLENGQKFIIGGMMLSIVKGNPERARQLLEDINREVKNKTDLDRIKPVIDELNAMVHL